MTRQREIPTIQYRSENLITSVFPIREGVTKFNVNGAARLNDAYGDVAGVGGSGTITMFEAYSGMTYKSPSAMVRKQSTFEETNRGLTRMIWDPDDFTTPVNPSGGYIPKDDHTLFLRLSMFDDASGTYLPEGPIVIVPPYDFFSTKEPTFTVTGIAPNLDIGDFPPNIPDVMLSTFMNFLLPAYSTTISIVNLDSTYPIFFSFHPGMPPSVLMPNQETGLTGAGVPEIFIASPNGNPWFTVRVAVVNSA